MSDNTEQPQVKSQQEIFEANSKIDNLASQGLSKALNEVQNFKHRDHFASLVGHLTSSLQSNIHTRDWYFKELDGYRNNFITNGIYNIIANDVFVDNGSVDFITVKMDEYPEVEEELIVLFGNLNITNVLQSILPDLLHYGSYAIRPVIKSGRGIIDLVDNIEPRNILALTDGKNKQIAFFIAEVTNQSSNSSNLLDAFNPPTGTNRISYKYVPITEVLYFSLDLSFSKIILDNKVAKQLRKQVPTDSDLNKLLLPSALKVKTSQSLVWPVLDKLKEVLLLDKLSVYRDIGSILTPNLVGIPVPDVYDPNQLIDIIKKYDDLLNSNVVKLTSQQNIDITLQELASVKVIPIVGDRSSPTPIDTGRSAPISNPQAMADSLNRLLNSIGIPVESFNGESTGRSNTKTHIRYAKIIKKIQKNIISVLKFIALLHISEKFPSLDIKDTDINIQLRNNTNIDELENLESQDLIISSISSIYDLIEKIEPLVGKSTYEIDSDSVIENMMSSFSSMGSKYHNIFKKKMGDQTNTTYTTDDESLSSSSSEGSSNNSLDNLDIPEVPEIVGDSTINTVDNPETE